MFYTLSAALVVLVAALVLVWALYILLRGDWLLGFIRGACGLAVIGLALVLALGAWDLFSYRELLAEKPVATLSFRQLDTRRYLGVLTLVDAGREHKFEVRGDQWQLDARILKWHQALSRFGVKPGYRLERLSGRYYALEEELSAVRTVYDLHQRGSPVDVWDWFDQVDSRVPWLDALYGNATFAPMSDGALYEISLTFSGLVSRPLNAAAESALQDWQ